MKFGEQPTYSREAYEDTEQGIKDIKSAARGEVSTEALRSLAAEKQALESQKAELHGQAFDEATLMDQEHNVLAADRAAQEEADAAEVARLRAEILGEDAAPETISAEAVPDQVNQELTIAPAGPSEQDVEDAYLINQFVDKRIERAEKGRGKMPSITELEAKSVEEMDAVTEKLRTEAGQAYLADEIPAVASPEQSASQPSATETAPMTAETVPAQKSNSDKPSLQDIPVPIFDAPSLEGGPNATEYTGKAIKEVSGGLIEYVPGTQQRLERGELTGYLFEGKDTIPAERLSELKSMLAQAERGKSAEAFEYARLSDSDPDANLVGAERMKNLSLDDKKGFEMALSRKKYANEKAQKKVLISGATAALATYISGLGATVLGSSAAGGLIFVAFPAVAGAGALAYGGKKIYDWYKQRKAAKNFMAASVARQASRGI